MTIRPYELLVRFTDGVPAGASVRYQEVIGDKVYDLDPEPLAGTTDPAFTAFAESFSSGLAEQLAAMTAERDSLATEKDALT